MYKKLSVLIAIVPLVGCLMSGATQQRDKRDDQLLFLQAQKALDARDYADAIELFQLFTENFPDSDGYTIALQRLGETFEGLLELEYLERVKDGEQEQAVKQEFLSKYGHFNCWKETPDGLRYNLTHYKNILEKYPDSPIADEAAYKIVPWEKQYHSRPEGPLKEIKYLEEILRKYPSTSLRPEILYKIAHRCHFMYEMYAFSPKAEVRDKDKDKAAQYRNKAIYMYKLVLESPSHTGFSQKAWKYLNLLEDGERINH